MIQRGSKPTRREFERTGYQTRRRYNEVADQRFPFRWKPQLGNMTTDRLAMKYRQPYG